MPSPIDAVADMHTAQYKAGSLMAAVAKTTHIIRTLRWVSLSHHV